MLNNPLNLWLTVCPKIERYEMEEESKSGSYADGKDMSMKCIKEGDIINLQDLLFHKNRDFLVKNNNERVCIITKDILHLVYLC